MSIDATRATAEAMPKSLSRRAMLGQSAAAVLLAAPLPAMARPSNVGALLAEHRALDEVASAAMAHFNSVESANVKLLPKVQVQVGRWLSRHEETGQETYVPVYAHTVKRIEDDFRALTATSGHRSPADLERARAWTERRDGYIAALRARETERAQFEADCGLTAAKEAFDAASERADEKLVELLETPPATFEDVYLVAGHLSALLERDDSYEWHLRTYLETLAGRQA